MSTLFKIVALFEKAGKQKALEAEVDLFRRLLLENGFDPDACDLPWFCEMLHQIVEGEFTRSRQYFEYPGNQPDVYNLLAELEAIIPGKWINHGETIEATFPFGVSFSLATADYYDIW